MLGILPALIFILFTTILVIFINKFAKGKNQKTARIIGIIIMLYVTFIIIVAIATYFKGP